VKIHFNAEIKIIKERIDSLIERDYMVKDEEDRNKYIYIP